MKITVITTTYNSDKTISENVRSVLNQTYKNFEQVIVDNLSDDTTLEIIKNLYKENNALSKLSIISEKDNGIADAMNKGIEAANGEIIGILNSDDSYYSSYVLESVYEAFREENILMVHGDIYFDDSVFGSNIRKPLLCSVIKSMPYNHPTVFFRRFIYDNYGKYNINYRYSMDFEFVCRLENRIKDFAAKSNYLRKGPMVKMKAGGVSWKNELESIEETKKALIENDFWNFSARQYYRLRKIRTKLKLIMYKLGLVKIVKLWRNYKWSS